MIDMHSLTKMRTNKDVSMKNRIAITTILLLVVCLVFGVAACDNGTLSAPQNLEMSGNVLSWQAVDGAESYEVSVQGQDPITTKDTTCFIEVKETGSYELRVRAKKGDVYSDYSETYVYVVASMLERPVVSYDELTKVVSWNAVDGAEGYTLRVRYTDKDISAEGAVIEMSEVSGTTYTLDKEEYTKPGSFTIEVKAIAPEGSEKSDSAYSDACIFVNSATLSAPTLSSITSTRVYWNSVSNASSYYLEARNKNNPEEVYSTTVKATTSTSVSVLLTNFNIQTPGEYTVHIKAVGDGSVYQDSAMTDVNEDFVIYKLSQLSDGCLVLKENEDGTTTASWSVTEEQLKLVETFALVLTPYDSDGDALLSAHRVTFNLSSDTDMAKLTVTEENGVKTYSYVIDNGFRTVNEGVTEYLLNDAYYGKRFTAEISASRSGNGVIAGTAVKAEEQYLSYKTPLKDGNGNYLISSAAELAYIVKNPDASFKQTANIDFEGYEWASVGTFGGKFDGGEYIISDITIIGDGENVGFFGEIKAGASVAGLKLVNVTLNSETAKFAGTIAGINNGTVSDCVVVGSVNAKYAVAGGIVGQNNATVTTSQSVADVTAAIAGGLAGKNASGATISYSNSKGNVSAKVEAPEEEKEVNVSESYAGGFVAVNSGNIINCYSVGNVVSESEVTLSAPNYAGGFVGLNDGSISFSYAGANFSNDYAKRNTVTAAGRNENISAGGFVGYNGGTIENSYANVKATSPKYVGGFVGYNAGKVENAYSIGGVTTGTATYGDGGFAGCNGEGATLTNVYYYDEILGDSENRTDKGLSTYVAIGDIGQTLATNLGDAFGVISGDNSVRNAVLKGMLYNVTGDITVSPGAEIKATVQYVGNDGAVNTITATNKVAEGETVSGSMICGNQTTEGTVVVVFSSGSFRGIVIVTVD